MSSWAARVAGAATAMLLARLGHDVVVVDQASFPSDTAVDARDRPQRRRPAPRWGLLDAVLASGAPAIRQVTFHAGGESVTPHDQGTRPVSTSSWRPAGTCWTRSSRPPRRQAGADVRTGVTVTGVQRDGAAGSRG